MHIEHVDTCLSCYLTDHHNRDGELLLAVVVDGKTTFADLQQGLLDELDAVVTDDLSEEQYEAATKAIKAKVHATSRRFDPSLEVSDDNEYADPCYAYFVLYYSN